MKITFLKHSGFALELDACVLVLDCWQDPVQAVDGLFSLGKPVYFLVSHVHEDHFNPEIFRWKDQAAGYILHRDCTAGAAGAPCHFMEAGDTYEAPEFSVHMYGSTDAGGSFMIRAGGKTIFHAGDLNWWHWAGEPDAENRQAAAWYREELGKIAEREVDLAFFPVDARQAVAREWGVTAFLSRIAVKTLLVPMHAFGTIWCPSYAFRWHFGEVPLWIPKREGDVWEA